MYIFTALLKGMFWVPVQTVPWCTRYGPGQGNRKSMYCLHFLCGSIKALMGWQPVLTAPEQVCCGANWKISQYYCAGARAHTHTYTVYVCVCVFPSVLQLIHSSASVTSPSKLFISVQALPAWIICLSYKYFSVHHSLICTYSVCLYVLGNTGTATPTVLYYQRRCWRTMVRTRC